MVKKYKDLKNKDLRDKLTQQEINDVNDVESYVDEQIELQWERGQVVIEYCVISFECTPVTFQPTTHTPEKREIMKNLILSIYEDSEWNIYINKDGNWRFLPRRK